jgi:DNA-binding CsgD family transcriptional regulator
MRFRPVDKKDLATCRALLHPGLGLSRRVIDRIVDIWSDLLPLATFSIVDDPSRPHPESIQGFGASAFVTDAFAEEFFSRPRNYLDAALYERILDGQSPVLSIPQIARANAADGVNLVVLNFGLRNHDIGDAQTQRVLQGGTTAFFALHAGYRIKSVLNEVFGARAAHYMEAGGFRPLVVVSGDDTHAAADDRPHLFGMRREWIEPAAVHPFSSLFHTARPQIGFSAAEQRVLVRALMNQPDPEIAASLGLSVDAVKKTWRRIYERVSRRIPFLIRDGERAAGGERRTVEKRRYLIEYLRTHLEEVRPWAPSKGQTSDPNRANTGARV